MPKKTNTKADPVPSENREIMDYLTENSEAIPSEIYVKLSDMLKKKYEKAPPKTKYYKIKYTLTEVHATMPKVHDDDLRYLSLHTRHETREAILRGVRGCTHRSHFKDVKHGEIQLNSEGEPCDFLWKIGGVLSDTCHTFVGENDDDAHGRLSSTMTIIEFSQYAPEV
jgi:hypothetical protein